MEKKAKKYYPGARRESYLRHKEKVKQYYQDNKEKIREYQKSRLKKIERSPEELEKFREYHRNYYRNVVKPKKQEGREWR